MMYSALPVQFLLSLHVSVRMVTWFYVPGPNVRLDGLLSFVKHLHGLPSPPEAFANVPMPATISSDTHLLHHVFNTDLTRESSLKLTLTEVLPHVRDATADLRAATIEGVAAIQALINAINSDRLFSRSGPIAPLEERLDAARDKLGAALESFKSRGPDAIAGAYGNKPRADVPLRSLYLGYVFGSTTAIIGDVVLSLVQTVAETSARRRKVRLWAPSSLRHVVKAVLKGRRKNEEQAFGEEEKTDEYDEDEDDIEEDHHREYLYRLQFGTLRTGMLQIWIQTAAHPRIYSRGS